MSRLNRLANAASNTRTLRALWILVSLGLIAVGAGAPGGWDVP